MPFNYEQEFPSIDPDCVSKFERTLRHFDWIDGESVVQAGETPTEEGFNVRFHKIENDLDNLGADVKQAFVCLAEMRTSLRSLLDEIRAELNRLQTLKQNPGQEAARVLTSKASQLVRDAFNVMGQKFPAMIPPGRDSARTIAACLRDLQLYLNLVINVCQTADREAFERSISGFRETLTALGFNPNWVITFYQSIKDNHGLEGEPAIVANGYIDYVISSLT